MAWTDDGRDICLSAGREYPRSRTQRQTTRAPDTRGFYTPLDQL